MTDRVPLPLPDWAYLLDVDGTLAPTAKSPPEAAIDPRTQQLIKLLYQASGGAVALVSGRSLDDVDRLFPGLRVPAAGQHGAEWRDASGVVRQVAVAKASLTAVRDMLAALAAEVPGLLLEDKGLTLALHYRAVPQLGGFVRHTVRSRVAAIGAGLVVQTGKLVVEVVPAGTDKGSAVHALMAIEPFRGRRPVFVGDDASDEHAFAVINALHGVSVKVGRGHTEARWRLADVAAVRAWLERGATRRPD